MCQTRKGDSKVYKTIPSNVFASDATDHCSEALKFQKQKIKSVASDIRRWTNTAEQKMKIQ